MENAGLLPLTRYGEVYALPSQDLAIGRLHALSAFQVVSSPFFVDDKTTFIVLQSVLSRLLGVGSVDTTYNISSTDIPLNNQEFQLGRCTSTFCESIWLKGASHNRLLFLLDGGELPVTLNITITNGTNRFSSMFEVIKYIN